MLTRRLLPGLTASLLLAACGDETSETPPPPAKQPPSPVDTKEPVIDEPKADVPPAEEWADTDEAIPSQDTAGDPDAASAGAESAGAAAEPTAFPGPCAVKWTTGAVLRFEYDNGTGSVRADQDGDGKAEACAKFETAEGHTTKVELDEGCDGSFETTIVPTYDEKTNIATATVTTGSESREVTLVVLPGYVGLTPGYLVQAPRKSVKVKASKGLVRSVRVNKPAEGPKLSVSFTYTPQGRVHHIKEDLEADGTVDRLMYYRYDEIGNVVGMKVTLTAGDTQDVGTARLSYTCHQTTEN